MTVCWHYSVCIPGSKRHKIWFHLNSELMVHSIVSWAATMQLESLRIYIFCPEFSNCWSRELYLLHYWKQMVICHNIGTMWDDQMEESEGTLCTHTMNIICLQLNKMFRCFRAQKSASLHNICITVWIRDPMSWTQLNPQVFMDEYLGSAHCGIAYVLQSRQTRQKDRNP